MENKPINEIIREKRKEKNISIDTLFKEIHIPSKFVHMIENGEWEKFPSKVHLKGFLKIYADYLKIAPPLVDRRIKEIMEPTTEEKKNVKSEDTAGKKLQGLFDVKEHSPLILFLTAVLIILCLVILYLLPE
jgi:cytoskeletal protein RodZ